MYVEIRHCQCDRVSGEQRHVALATLGTFPETSSGHAIDASTMVTDDVHPLTHLDPIPPASTDLGAVQSRSARGQCIFYLLGLDPVASPGAQP